MTFEVGQKVQVVPPPSEGITRQVFAYYEGTATVLEHRPHTVGCGRQPDLDVYLIQYDEGWVDAVTGGNPPKQMYASWMAAAGTP